MTIDTEPGAEQELDTAEQARQKFLSMVLQDMIRRLRAGWAIQFDSVGITVNLEKAYGAYAAALAAPSDFARGCDAIDWWNQGGIIGWWRHTIIKHLLPCRYSKMRKWQERGRRMKQQAVLNAILLEHERVSE